MSWFELLTLLWLACFALTLELAHRAPTIEGHE